MSKLIKKYLGFSVGFIALYLFFLVSIMPLSFVSQWIELPKNISISKVSGSIWQGKISAVVVDEVAINNIETNFSFFSLLAFSPEIVINFGDPLLKGPEGRVTLSGLFADVTVENLTLSAEANLVAEQLQLPIAVIAHDYIDVEIERFVLGQPVCAELVGNIVWQKAAVTALSEKVTLGKLAADLTCQQGEMVVEIDPKNDLGLSFTASVGQGFRASGDGYLTPTDSMPQAIQQVLPFLGNADNQGRYRLRF